MTGTCLRALFLGLAAGVVRPVVGDDRTIADAPSLLEDYTVRRWTAEDGLPESAILGISQSPDGYFWLVSKHTISRFDGHRFQALSDSAWPVGKVFHLFGLMEQADRTVWVHGYQGLLRYRGGRWDSVAEDFFRTNREENVERVRETGDGSVWMATRGGLLSWERGDGVRFWERRRDPPQGERFSDLALDRDGRLWLGAWDGLYRFETGIFRRIELPLPPGGPQLPIRVAPSRRGGVWVYGQDVSFRGDERAWEVVRRPTDSGNVENILESADGSLWAAGNMGVYRYDGESWSRLLPEDVPGMTRFLAVFESRAGEIWVGGEGALLCIRPKGYRFVAPDRARIEPRGVPSVAWCDGGSDLLVGLQNRVFRYRSGALEELLSLPSQSFVTALLRTPAGDLWIGTSNDFLWRWRDGSLKQILQSPSSGFSAAGVTALARRTDGRLFVGTTSGLMTLTRDDNLLEVSLGYFPNYRVDSLCAAGDGTLWIGYERIGLHALDRAGRATRFAGGAGGPAGRINTIVERRGGGLWIGTSRGLVRWIAPTESREFTEAAGLPSGGVTQIAEDGGSRLWMGSPEGIVCIGCGDLDEAAAGRRSLVPVRRAGAAMASPGCTGGYGGAPVFDGAVWFPLVDGVARTGPEFLADKRTRPRVVIEEVRANGRLLADLNPPLALPAPTPAVTVPPGARNLEFRFTAVGDRSAERTRFRYRLAGSGASDWRDAEQGRSALVPFVPPGAYEFQVEAMDFEGGGVAVSATLPFAVRPFFWQAPWFIGVLAAACAASVVAITRLVLRRRYRRRLRAQMAIAEERSRIARDIHDELGAGLTHLAMIARMADRAGEPSAAREALDDLFRRAREMVRSVDEIVWAVSPANDHLPSLLDYLGQYAQYFLRAAGVACRVDLPDPVPHLPVRSPVRHHLYMALREALNNVVRHSGATEAAFRASLEGTELVVDVSDNGRGFDPEAVRAVAGGEEHAGLGNLKARMERAGGCVRIESSMGVGTRVRFRIPIPPDGENPPERDGRQLT